MSRILKYQLKLVDVQVVELPQGATLLDVQEQKGELQLWAMVNQEEVMEDILIEIIGTGNGRCDCKRTHLATVQIPKMGFVWHIFETVKPWPASYQYLAKR